MLSKKTQKGILYGFLGGVAGFIAAVILFVITSILLFGVWGTPQFFPLQVLMFGIFIASFILVISLILRIKQLGISISLIIFFISYITTLKICRMTDIPITARQIPVFCATMLSVPFLLWIMFIIGGIKVGVSIANKIKSNQERN